METKRDVKDNSLQCVDSEEVRIFRQSLPAEEVTRDFLQELLQEHQANANLLSRAPADKGQASA
ncbi:MAG TPA: hypothetical protein VMZ74_10230 [Ramlibacter sp.]|nr:hypothetical protein [Ramlibacter sp.]